ncbi:MAG TPA: LytTR family DNA-binding domain-containing protein [Saprospiraceae bacterium]|nr:LytTR family DNA-binding domain-containing protein [Saprospiraceae bacterium]
MRVLILDDDPCYLRLLSDFVQRTSGLVLEGAYERPEEVYDILTTNPPDLLISDVEMPGVNGIDFVKSLPRQPLVVFMTSFPEFAVKSYEVEAADFLTKPVSFDRFLLAVGRVRERLKARNLLHNEYSLPGEGNYFFVRTDMKYVRVFYDDVLYFEAMKDYVQIITTQGRHVAHLSLRGLAETLPSSIFIRIHRSYLVNQRHIHSIGPDEVGVGAATLPLGMSYRDNVTEQLVFKNLLKK